MQLSRVGINNFGGIPYPTGDISIQDYDDLNNGSFRSFGGNTYHDAYYGDFIINMTFGYGGSASVLTDCVSYSDGSLGVPNHVARICHRLVQVTGPVGNINYPSYLAQNGVMIVIRNSFREEGEDRVYNHGFNYGTDTSIECPTVAASNGDIALLAIGIQGTKSILVEPSGYYPLVGLYTNNNTYTLLLYAKNITSTGNETPGTVSINTSGNWTASLVIVKKQP